MTSFMQHLTEDRRLCLLRLLAEGGSANERVLALALPQIGHARVSAADLRADLRHLEAQGCITLEYLDGLAVATILQRGLDASHGAVEIAGVRVPSPTEL